MYKYQAPRSAKVFYVLLDSNLINNIFLSRKLAMTTGYCDQHIFLQLKKMCVRCYYNKEYISVIVFHYLFVGM